MSYDYGDDDDETPNWFDQDDQDDHNDDSQDENSYDCGYDHDYDECHDYDNDGFCDHDLDKDGHCIHDEYTKMDEFEGMGDGIELEQLPYYGSAFYNSKLMRGWGYQGGEMVTPDVLHKVELLYDEYMSNLGNNEEDERPVDDYEDENEGAAAAAAAGGALVIGGNDTSSSRSLGRSTDRDPDWVRDYNDKLAQYGTANNNPWQRDNTADEDGIRPWGLKGRFANGTEVHYTDPDKLSIETPEDAVPTADHFKEIVALAKDEEQEIKLGPTMRPEFKAALIEACAKGGVEIQNLSNEDREIYNRFKPKEESKDHAQEGDKNFLHGGYDGYLSPESAKIRYNMMERLAKTPAKDQLFNDVKDYSGLDEKIASLKKAGAVIGKDSKESAELTLAEYVKASVASADKSLDEVGQKRLANLEKALGCYNLDVHKEQAEEGKPNKTVFAHKKAGDRSYEEQEEMKYAVLQLQPQDKKYDTDIRNMTISAIRHKSGGYTQ